MERGTGVLQITQSAQRGAGVQPSFRHSWLKGDCALAMRQCIRECLELVQFARKA